jgi:hypothetical protein
MEREFVSQAYGPSWGCYTATMVGMNVAASTMDMLTGRLSVSRRNCVSLFEMSRGDGCGYECSGVDN